MTDAELDIASSVLYLEEQVADLETMLVNLPRDEFRFPQNVASFARLRAVAVTALSLYCAAREWSEPQTKEDECR